MKTKTIKNEVSIDVKMNMPLPVFLENTSLKTDEEWKILEYFYQDELKRFQKKIYKFGDPERVTITNNVFNHNKYSSLDLYSEDGLIWLGKTLCKWHTKNLSSWDELFKKIEDKQENVDYHKIFSQHMDYLFSEQTSKNKNPSMFRKLLNDDRVICWLDTLNESELDHFNNEFFKLIDNMAHYDKLQNFDISFIHKLNKKFKNNFIARCLEKYEKINDTDDFDPFFVKLMESTTKEDYDDLLKVPLIKDYIGSIWIKELSKDEDVNFYLLKLMSQNNCYNRDIPTYKEMRDDFGFPIENKNGNSKLIPENDSLLLTYLLISAKKYNKELLQPPIEELQDSIIYKKEQSRIQFLLELPSERERVTKMMNNHYDMLVSFFVEDKLPAYTLHVLGKEMGLMIFGDEGNIKELPKYKEILTYNIINALMETGNEDYQKHVADYMGYLLSLDGFEELYPKALKTVDKTLNTFLSFNKYIKPHFDHKKIKQTLENDLSNSGKVSRRIKHKF